MITKHLALPAFVAIYAAFGIGLLITSPSRTPDSFDGKIQWNPFTEEMTIRVDSNRAIINLDEYDVENTRIVRSHPDSQILIRVTGGNPTRLKGKLPDGVLLVNPAGVYVGPDSVVDVGATNVISTLELLPEDSSFEKPFEFLSEDSLKQALNRASKEGNVFIGNFANPEETSETSSVELKAHGNVYALAINKSGVVRASGPNQKKGRVILRAEPEKAKRDQ